MALFVCVWFQKAEVGPLRESIGRKVYEDSNTFLIITALNPANMTHGELSEDSR